MVEYVDRNVAGNDNDQISETTSLIFFCCKIRKREEPEVKTLLVTVLMATMLLTVGGRTFAADEIPWGVERIRANLVWNTNAGNGITIAVIDTGVVDADYYQHPDLVGKIVAGETFVPGSWWDDLQNHGTLVAGIMAAIINDFGLIGV